MQSYVHKETKLAQLVFVLVFSWECKHLQDETNTNNFNAKKSRDSSVSQSGLFFCETTQFCETGQDEYSFEVIHIHSGL